jgi:2,3-bisphosphoglycerate-dependent phosphoglycerate mutase
MDGVYLIRHCETSGQAPDAPLTSAGLDQAVALAKALSFVSFKRIVSSDYKRAVQSAEPLAVSCGIEVETDPRFRERNLGSVPGDDWLAALARTFIEVDLAFPTGESTKAATDRATAALDEIRSMGQGPVAVFTHGNLLSLIARSVDSTLGFEFWRGLKNPDVYELCAGDCGGKLRRIAL